MANAIPVGTASFEDKREVSVAEAKTDAVRRMPTRHSRCARVRALYGDGGLDQQDNATEGGKPGIDSRRIGEEARFCGRLVKGYEYNDKHCKCENLGIRCLLFGFNQRLVDAVIFAHHRNVYARAASRSFGGGCHLDDGGRLPSLGPHVGTMVVTRRLNRYMAIRPQAKNKGRRVARSQTEMSEHCDDKPRAKPCL
jgi:hypothetical protein